MKLSEGLKEFLNQRKPLSEGLKKQKVLTTFSEAIGTNLQKHVKHSKFEQGILYVAVATPALKSELSYAKEKIMEQINTTLGETVLKKIVIV